MSYSPDKIKLWAQFIVNACDDWHLFKTPADFENKVGKEIEKIIRELNKK